MTTYEYLGTVITDDGTLNIELAKRKQKTDNIYCGMNKTVLGYRKTEITTRRRVYNLIVVCSSVIEFCINFRYLIAI